MSEYSRLSAFASCPAATGVMEDCPIYPDGAHRCSAERGHAGSADLPPHRCTCGAEWHSVSCAREKSRAPG